MCTSSDKDIRRLYGDLAWTWPIISPPDDYIEESEEFIELITTHAKIPVKNLLNLGCGGGHNDFTLKTRFQVTGADISDNMLSLARGLNPDVTYVKGDMRSLRLGRQFEAVTVFDSISYMSTRDDLISVLRTAYEHLNPGGVMVTVVEYRTETFQQSRITHSTRRRGDVEIALVENDYDPDPNDSSFEFTMIFLIRRSGVLSTGIDRHILGLFPLDSWVDTMRGVGFDVTRTQSVTADEAGEYFPILIGVRPLR